MNFKKSNLAIVAVLAGFMISGCKTGTSPTQLLATENIAPTKTAISTNTPPPTQTPDPTSTYPPTSTHTLDPTPTPVPSLTPSPVPTQAVLSGIVRRLCPDLRAPLGLFTVPEQVYDNSTDPPTPYVPYQVLELGLDSSAESCTFYLSPPPMGDPQFAGDSLFWKSFDDDTEQMMVWKYDQDDVGTDDGYPQSSSLPHTQTDTSIGKSGLFDFVVADSGETLVWSYTDPRPNVYENEMGYVQSMFGGETIGPIDQRPSVEIWNDIVAEGDSPAKIFRPRKISSDGERVFYSQEPVGLGTQWPNPLGFFTSLYSISTWWGDGIAEMLYDCGMELWCISDFSEEQGILVTIHGETIRILELSSGELIREVQAPEAYPLARHAKIGPDGTIAFLGVAMGESDHGDPPEDAAVFLIEPPYQDEPVLVLRVAGLLNLLGWASPSLLLVDGNNLAENTAGESTQAAQLMLVDVETGVGTWLLHNANQFVSLIY